MTSGSALKPAPAKAREEARPADGAAPTREEVQTPMPTKATTLLADQPVTHTAATAAGEDAKRARADFWRSNALPLGMVTIMLLILLYFAFTVK
jgi:hypothetical protein